MANYRQEPFCVSVVLFMAGVILYHLIATTPAIAQRADADVLVAQAVLAYDDKRYEEALKLLKQALELDPRNARGLYYTGLVYLALQQPDQAIAPLETVRALRPTDIQAQYQLGVAYFTVGDYDKAAPLLEEVFQRQPDLENLGYYVGFMRYRQKAYTQAVQAFEATKTSDPNIQQLALFYKGLALGVLGQSEQAIADLAAAQQVQAATPITGAAGRFQEALATGQRMREEKRFRAQVSVGGYYDDNVAINPNPSRDPLAEAFRTRKTTAPGMIASALADYSFYRDGPIETTVTGSFLQTLNFNDGLDSFNLQNYLGGLSGYYRGTIAEIPYQLAAVYTYDYLFLGELPFLSRHTPTFSATVVPPSFNAPFLGTVGNLTTILYRYQVKDFYREPAGVDFRFVPEQRDAFNNMIGLLQTFRFAQDRFLLRIGYQYDNEAAKGASFTYTGNLLQSGGQMMLPFGDISVRYDYQVHWRAYKNPQGVFVNDDGGLSQRYDIEQTHLVQVIKPITSNLTLTAQYQRVRNDTNIPLYDYTKNVFTGLVTWIY